jgi:hypothetical protein
LKGQHSLAGIVGLYEAHEGRLVAVRLGVVKRVRHLQQVEE